MKSKIDFVITYVDGNDSEWQKEKNKYTPGETADLNKNRYREWDNLKYLFRGIEKFAPWVRKVHFVTYGHLPSWLNMDHPKLHIVNHEDYIPKKWLPTFNNRCIELNLHRIPGLSEQFVYFNDDMFLTKAVSPRDFFKNGMPVESAIMYAINYKATDALALHVAPLVDVAIINKHFNIKQVIKKNPLKWFNPKYGLYNFISLPMIVYHNFSGFWPFHVPYSYLKSTFDSVWDNETEICISSSEHKFREPMDINQWLMNYWQFASGNFYPRKISDGKVFQLHTFKNALNAASAIDDNKYKMICLNDCVENDQEFEKIKSTVNSSMRRLLPNKSEFEL